MWHVERGRSIVSIVEMSGSWDCWMFLLLDNTSNVRKTWLHRPGLQRGKRILELILNHNKLNINSELYYIRDGALHWPIVFIGAFYVTNPRCLHINLHAQIIPNPIAFNSYVRNTKDDPVYMNQFGFIKKERNLTPPFKYKLVKHISKAHGIHNRYVKCVSMYH